MNIKSGLLKQTGKTAEADKLMTDAMTIATEVELNAYGYQLIAEGNMDKAIEVLALNTQRFPKSANAWDSLGEAQAMKGDKTNAIKNFKKSLSLNPPENVKLNSEKYLRQLGAI
jgi:Flp pilus assembly protein TadD